MSHFSSNIALRRAAIFAVTAGFLSASIVGCSSSDDEMVEDDMMDDDMSSLNEDMNEGEGMANDAMAQGDIIAVATGPGMSNVTTLVEAVKAAGLVETLKGPGPYTVFAPTNAAFNKLPPGKVEDLLKPENKEQLRSILLYHVVEGRQDAKAVMGMDSATTVEGGDVTIETRGGKVMVGPEGGMATVTKADVPATNGVIHQIDTVLMPPM